MTPSWRSPAWRSTRRVWRSRCTWQRPGTELDDDQWVWGNALRLGVLLEDGMKIGAAAREDPPENLNTLPETPRIAGLSGMGGGIHGSMQHWLYPLPAG